MNRILQLSFLLFLAIVFSDCKNAPNQINDDFSLVVRIDRDIPQINPILAKSSREREIYPYLFLNLLDHDPKTLELSPVLAESMPERKVLDDGRISYEFKILEEATWSDGQPIQAADFLFTLKAIAHPEVICPSAKTAALTVDEVLLDPVDPKKITYIVGKDEINVLESICSIEVYPEHIYDTAGKLSEISLKQMRDENFTSELIENDSIFTAFASSFSSVKYGREIVEGAGPYRLKAWEGDQYIQLEKKENWWGDKYPERTSLMANPKEIIFQVIADDATALTQLKGGSIDVMKITDGNAFVNLQKEFNDDFAFSKPSINQYYFLAMNNEDEMMKHVEVRKALAHTIDIPKIIEVLETGDATQISSAIAPFVSSYKSEFPLINRDVKQAVSLLEENGWGDADNDGIFDKLVNNKLVELNLEMLASSEKSEKLALIVKENAKEIGINISITRKKFTLILNEHVYKGDYQMFPMASSWDLNPYDPYRRWHSDNAVSKGGNLNYYKNESVDNIIKQIKGEVDANERLKLYADFDRIVNEDQPVVLLYRPLDRIVTNKKFKPLTANKRPGYFVNAFELADVSVFSAN